MLTARFGHFWKFGLCLIRKLSLIFSATFHIRDVVGNFEKKMKVTKLTNEIMQGDSSVDSYPWLSLLHSLHWKLSQLDKVSTVISSSLFYSIILDLTGIIEGFTNQTLDRILESRTSFSFTAEELEELEETDFWDEPNENESNEESEFNERLIDNLKRDLLKSTWSGYNNAFKLIFGKSILEKLDNDIWKCINSLFTLRNMIIHGKILSINYNHIEGTENYNITVDNKYQSVYSYLSEKNLIEVGPTGYVELVSEISIMHYFDNVKQYIREIVLGIENKKERDEIIEICSMDINLVNIINGG